MNGTATETSRALELRAAAERDVESICGILAQYARHHILLPRTQEDIRKHLGGFIVAERDGAFVGCVALRDFGGSLFEIRSLSVHESSHRSGIGTALVQAAVDKVKGRGPSRVFALTYRASLFQRLGFTIVDKSLFPQKIWSDCSICRRKDCCDETAVLLEIA